MCWRVGLCNEASASLTCPAPGFNFHGKFPSEILSHLYFVPPSLFVSLFARLCFHMFISPLNKELHQLDGCSNGTWEMAHLAMRMAEVGPTDLWLSLSLSFSALIPVVLFSLVLWRTLTFTLFVLPCRDCLGENVVIVLVKIEKGRSQVCRDVQHTPVCVSARVCVRDCKSHILGISDLIQNQYNLSLIRFTPQHYSGLYHQYGRS